MGTSDIKKYITELIANANRYSYYTDDQNTILSLRKFENIKTNKDLSCCLKNLHNENLVYLFLHQESYINPETGNILLDLRDELANLLLFLDSNPEEEISKINLNIERPLSDLSYLMVIEKTLDIKSVESSITLTENALKNISVETLYCPIIFNENIKMHDVPSYYGRYSYKEGVIEIPQIDKQFKSSSLTHESFHYLNAHILNCLQVEYPNLKTDAKEFTEFIYATQIYEDIPDIFEVDTEEIKNNNNFKEIFKFYNEFDKIPKTNRLSKTETKEYVEKYLNINIKECISETDFTNQILKLYSNEKAKLPNEVLNIIPENTHKIKLLAKEMYEYYQGDNIDKSMYSLMSDMISKIASEKNDYRCSLNEKCARIFEMNSYKNSSSDIYKLLAESISDKNIYPIGSEREYYLSSLNNQLRNMSPLLNKHILLAESLPTPREKYRQENIPKGFNISALGGDEKFDLNKISQCNVLSNIQSIRDLSNKYSTSNYKYKI